MLRPLRLLLLSVLVLSVGACDSSEPEMIDPGPAPASFRIASRVVTDGNGDEYLLFAARPTETIALSLVNIENPVGQREQFNANNQLVAANDVVDLQAPGFGYFRVSGEWSFRFTYISQGGAGDQVVVTETVNVGARVRNN